MENVTNSLFLETKFSNSLVITFAALLTSIHFQKVDYCFGAHYLEKAVALYDRNYKNKEELKSQKSLLLISYLYHFQLCHAKLIFDILNMLTCDITEFNLNLLFMCMRELGSKLRRDDAKYFRDFFVTFNKKVSVIPDNQKSKHLKFLVEFITDLKNNKTTEDKKDLVRIKKWIRSIVSNKQVQHSSKRVICLGLQDLLKEGKSGNWWEKTESFNNTTEKKISKKELLESLCGQLKKSDRNAALKKSEKFGFNDLETAIFMCIVTSSNCVDALKKLDSLYKPKNLEVFFPNLVGKPTITLERTVVAVIFRTLQSEINFSLYYAVLLKLLFASRKATLFTFKLRFWEFLKNIGNHPNLHIKNVACLLSFFHTEKIINFSDVVMKVEMDTIAKNKKMSTFLTCFLSQVISECDTNYFRESFSLFIDKHSSYEEPLEEFVVKNRKKLSLMDKNKNFDQTKFEENLSSLVRLLES